MIRNGINFMLKPPKNLKCPICGKKCYLHERTGNYACKGRPSLGIQVNTGFTKEVADRFGIPEGILVYKVEIFSAAYKADIQEDDVITEFNGVRVKNYDELEEQKSKFKPGDTVKIKIYRYHQEGKGEELTVDVVMDEQK